MLNVILIEPSVNTERLLRKISSLEKEKLKIYATIRDSYLAINSITNNCYKHLINLGLYEVLTNPSGKGIKTARQLVPALKQARTVLLSQRTEYEALDNRKDETYKLIQFIDEMLTACTRYEYANIESGFDII
jgi:pyruvate formate-lyase activating enzyme-like uncharacterized protein